MTKEAHQKVLYILTNGMDVDPTTQTAYDVYNSILRMTQPLDNGAGHRCDTLLSDDTLKLFLTSFDYRSDSYATDIYEFCKNMSGVVNKFAKSGDKQLIAIVAILTYARSIDICNDSCNNLINDIVNNLSLEESYDTIFQIDTMTAMLSSNIVGQQSLDLETKFQTNELVSAFGDLLGTECMSRSSASNVAVPKCYMRSMQEWGIDVSKFLQMNQCVVNGKPISSSEIMKLVDSLQLDTNEIDFERFKPTIYDIINIRFCRYFQWIFQQILSTPNKDTKDLILNTVTKCLLETDKKFIELGYSYLTLIEILFNCLYAVACSNSKQMRYAYYPFIRAKQLTRHGLQPNSLLDVSLIGDVDKLQTIYRQVDKLQKQVIISLTSLGFVGPSDDDCQEQSLMESLMQTLQI